MKPIVKKFYDALKKKKLMGFKCPKCGTYSFPPKPTCNNCGNIDLKWVEISGKGKLKHYNVENFPGGEFQDIAPYAVGLVHLKEDVPYFAMIEGVDLEDPWEGNQELPVDVEAKIKKVGTKTIVAFKVVK